MSFGISVSHHVPALASQAAPSGQSADWDGYLSPVLAELAQMMGAESASLTLHPARERRPMLLHERSRLGADSTPIFDLLGRSTLCSFQDGVCQWRSSRSDDGASVLLMPIDLLTGHNRLVVSVLFRTPSLERRAAAERLFRERRPFVLGFFHLWQRHRLLERRASSLEAALNQTAIGLVMLSDAGRIVHTNKTADELLAQADGIGRSHDTLRATTLRDGVNLQAAITHAILGDAPTASHRSARVPLVAFQRRTGAPLVAAILSAEEPTVEPDDIAAIVYIVDPKIDVLKMLGPMCGLYGLSQVETTLVCHLASGLTLASAAEQMRIKEQTARTYLKTIFIKTGTARQAELIVLMLSSLIRIRRDVLQEAISHG